MKPTENELKQWILSTVRHVQHIEYYLEQLQVGTYDPQRPHDIIGTGNKFEWEVMKGFALQYRDKSKDFFDMHVHPALQRHRCQYHHQKWNDINLTATPDDLKLGAVDALCSLLEPDRTYQGGKHSFQEIETIIKKNQAHKAHWLEEMLREMRRIPPPDISTIVSVENFPNIGIPSWTYDCIRTRVHDTLQMISSEEYRAR